MPHHTVQYFIEYPVKVVQLPLIPKHSDKFYFFLFESQICQKCLMIVSDKASPLLLVSCSVFRQSDRTRESYTKCMNKADEIG